MPDLLQTMFEDGFLSSSELVAIRRTCRELHENPVRILRSLNIASPEEIQAYFQKFFNCGALPKDFVDTLDTGLSGLLPEDLALQLGVFGLLDERHRVHIAMEDPSDVGTIHKLEFFLDQRVVPVAATANQLARALTKLYHVDASELNFSTVLEASRGIGGKMFAEEVDGGVTKSHAPEHRADRHETHAVVVQKINHAHNTESKPRMKALPVMDDLPDAGEDRRPGTLPSPAKFDLPPLPDDPLPSADDFDDVFGGSAKPAAVVARAEPVDPLMDFGDLSSEASDPLMDFGGSSDSSEKIEALPDFDGSLESTDSLPDFDDTADTADTAGSLPDFEASAETTESLPDFDDTAANVESLPDFDDTAANVESLPDFDDATETSSEIADPLPEMDEPLAAAVDPAAEIQALADELIAELSAAVNAVLMKLTFTRSADEAVGFLNEKLAPIGAHVELIDDVNFTVVCQNFTVEGNLNESPDGQAPLAEALYPVVKRIAKMRAADF